MKPIQIIVQVSLPFILLAGLGGDHYHAQAAVNASVVSAQGSINVFEGAPFSFEFESDGGYVQGSVPITEMWETSGEFKHTIQVLYSGTFSGSNGGQIEGTCEISYSCYYTGEEDNDHTDWGGDFACALCEAAAKSCDCRWNGTLYNNGQGNGSSWCTEGQGEFVDMITGDWQVTFPASVLSGTSQGSQFQHPQVSQAISETKIPIDDMSDDSCASCHSSGGSSQPIGAPSEFNESGETFIEIAETNSVSIEELQEAITLEREEINPEFSGRPVARLLQWNGNLVSVNVDENGQPYLEDVNGNGIYIDDHGIPLQEDVTIESNAGEIIQDHPEIDWNPYLDTFNNTLGDLLTTIGSPNMELVQGSGSDPQPSSLLTDLHNTVSDPDALGIEELSEEESQTIQIEDYALYNNGIMSETSDEIDLLMEQVFKETMQSSASRFKEELSQGLTAHIEQVQSEQPQVPIKVTEEFYNNVAVVIGEKKINELVEEVGLDPDAAC